MKTQHRSYFYASTGTPGETAPVSLLVIYRSYLKDTLLYSPGGHDVRR